MLRDTDALFVAEVTRWFPVTSLFLPILVSAVAVFLASSIVHMPLPYAFITAFILTVFWPE